MILFPVLALGIWILVSLPFYKMGYEGNFSSDLDEPRTKTNWNAIALFVNIRNGELKLPEIPKRKTGIDKEIADEEKEIAELERQKEKIETLAKLKRRKERLFKEVHDNETSKEYTHCKWCCVENSLKMAINREGISYPVCIICGGEQ